MDIFIVKFSLSLLASLRQAWSQIFRCFRVGLVTEAALPMDKGYQQGKGS
ncbi:MAG: hypothetical protein K0R76_1068 [Alphaproteobacteria bacterium]|jgi:hypothetical protein|nr:hypothetical protein [Alphaproteobacteria bacterium]